MGRPTIKYIVTNNSAEARKELLKISNHIGLEKDSKTNQYAPLVQIDEEDSPDTGKYIIPIVTEGKFKCDDLYDSSELIEYQEHWDSRQNVGELVDTDSEDSNREED
jgi:hypothetical protein